MKKNEYGLELRRILDIALMEMKNRDTNVIVYSKIANGCNWHGSMDYGTSMLILIVYSLTIYLLTFLQNYRK